MVKYHQYYLKVSSKSIISCMVKYLVKLSIISCTVKALLSSLPINFLCIEKKTIRRTSYC